MSAGEVSPEAIEYLLGLAERYIERNDVESAICVWRNILLFDPHNKEALARLHTATGVRYLFRGHPHCETVLSAFWMSDGESIATLGSDNNLSIWDYPSGELKAVFDTQDSSITSFDVNPKAPLIALGLKNGGIIIYNTLTYRKVVLRDHNSCITSMAWDPSGKRLVSCDLEGNIIVWSLINKSIALRSYGEVISRFKWGGRGRYILGYTHSGIINIWNSRTGRLLYRVNVGSNIYSADWSPNGEQVVFADSDYRIDIFDLRHVSRYTLGRHRWMISHVFWTTDGSIVSIGWDGKIGVWDPHSRKLLYNIPIEQAPITKAVIAKSGRYIALAQPSNKVFLVDLRERRTSPIFRVSGRIISDINWHPRLKKLLIVFSDGKLGIIDTKHNKVEYVFDACSNPITSLDWLPDNRFVALGYADGQVSICDLAICKPVKQRLIARDGISSISFGKSSNILAVGSRLNTVFLVDVEMLSILCSTSLPTVGISVVKFDPSGRKILVGMLHGGTFILDTTCSIIREIVGSPRAILDASWNRDGSKFALATHSDFIEIWSTNNESPPKVLRISRHKTTCIDWNKKIHFIAVGTMEGTIHVLNLDSEKIYAEFNPHDNAVRKVLWSPDGAKLASCGDDGKLIVYNLVKKKFRTINLGQPICSLSWAQSGSSLLCGCKNGDIVAVDVSQ